MSKMSGKRQIFKISTLKELLNEENSCVSLVSCTRLLAIPPFYLNDMKGGVIFSLNKILKTYDQSLNGIVIGYQNVTILWDENSGKIRMGGYEADLNVRVEFYVFQPRIGNILEGIVNKKSDHHIGCLVHRCFNATILKPDDVTCEDWFCKDFNINDKVTLRVKDLDFTCSVPYIEGEIDESLFNQCRPNTNNVNCDFKSSMVLTEKKETTVSQEPDVHSDNSSGPTEPKKIKNNNDDDNIINDDDDDKNKDDDDDKNKDEEKKNIKKEEKYSMQKNQPSIFHSLKSALDISVNSEISNSDLKTNESLKSDDTTTIFEELTKIKTKKNIKNQDEVDNKEENKVKKKKDKKSKKKDKEGVKIQIEDFSTLTEKKCVDSLHDDDVKIDSFDAEFLKSKKTKTKKKKKDEPYCPSESPKKRNEVSSVSEETDNIFYSTQLDPLKKSEKLNITFCSPILPEPLPGKKKRKKEKDKRQQVLESSLTVAKKEEEEESSTKGKKSKSLKRKREEESETEGVSTPKKYKNGNMYDVVHSQSPEKKYVEDKSLFSDSEKSFKMSPFKKEVKLNGDVHNVLEKCDTENDLYKSAVQSLLNEVREEVSEKFQMHSEIQNGERCQPGEKNKKSKAVKAHKEEKTTKKEKKKKKKEKKEKEKNNIKGSEETSLTENTATSLYEKLLQEAMNSINVTNEEASSASSATIPLEGKKQRRKKTKETAEA